MRESVWRGLAHPYYRRRYRLLPLSLPVFLTVVVTTVHRSYAVERSKPLDTRGIGVKGSEEEVG